ncbi:Uncharacterized protein cmbei_4003060 [Cryptosporidium meleagridis]
MRFIPQSQFPDLFSYIDFLNIFRSISPSTCILNTCICGIRIKQCTA